MTAAQIHYQKYLKSWRWRILRGIRKWVDGGRCRMCGSTKRLEVHHRSYLHRGNSWLGELMDLTTCCKNCHSDYHDGD